MRLVSARRSHVIIAHRSSRASMRVRAIPPDVMWTQAIPGEITPKNRLLIGAPRG